MLRLPPFRFRVPERLDEVLAILSGEGAAARVVAGGTDLWPNMKRRHQKAETVVSLMRIPELAGIEANGAIRIGATETLDRVARDRRVRARLPALARAVESISSPPLRNMGTIGGNVCVDTRCTYYNQTEEWRRSIDYCLKEEGTVCWVAPGSKKCWAHTATDSAPVLAALGASVELAGPGGRRELAVADLYRDDGIDYLAKGRDEIVTAIVVPEAADASRCRSAFWKLRRRGSIDFAVLSVAVAAWTDGAAAGAPVRRARMVLGAVGSMPLAVPAGEKILERDGLGEEAIAAAAREARRVATPMDNTDFVAQWRGVMAERYAEAALREIAGLPRRRPLPAHPL